MRNSNKILIPKLTFLVLILFKLNIATCQTFEWGEPLTQSEWYHLDTTNKGKLMAISRDYNEAIPV